MKNASLFELLELNYDLYNRKDFIYNDPIIIPHSYSKKEDIEISAFLTSTIAWGQRVSIIQNSRKLMNLMNDEPYDFIKNAKKNDIKPLLQFTHRTFNGDDCIYFVHSLQHIYNDFGGLEEVFTQNYIKTGNIFDTISIFHNLFFKNPHLKRTEKHISNPSKGSAAKRINMFLRWMVRKDDREVDFGIWKQISTSDLLCPLDVHSGTIARKLGLVNRKQNDRKAVDELMVQLKKFDSYDPVKYDFALFGMGVSNKVKSLYNSRTI